MSDHLFATLYGELHRLAESHLRSAGPEVTVSPTTVIHEAWLDFSRRNELVFADRARFLGYAARAMRGIVIDYVRQSRAQKRGGGVFPITLVPDITKPVDEAEELTRLSDTPRSSAISPNE